VVVSGAVPEREELFTPWRARWVLHEDAHVIVVDKPVGVSTHAADPARRDDVVSRLQDWLGARDGVAPSSVYLGVHQRLDKGTSGVLLFARDRSANGPLAEAFAGRTAEKRYLAVVEPAPRGAPGGTLTHLVERGDGDLMRARPVLPKDRVRDDDPRLAVTRYEVLAREDGRALLAFTPRTGRTHQIRVQAAAAGFPLVGDVAYGGAAAPRVMLHAAALTLPHPAHRRPVCFEAPTPDALAAALERRAPSVSLRDKLLAAADARWHLARDPAVTAFRLAHDGDDFADCPVDLYGDHAVLNARGPAHDPRLASALVELGLRGVYAKHRPKQANTLVSSRRADIAPPNAVAGEDAPAELVVTEHGLRYRVRLGDGLSTGVFLDQRENRRRVRELARGAAVLNLFAYTGPFTVAAAAGGARRTVSVDVSKDSLAWAAANLDENGFDRAAHVFAAQDVFGWLTGARARGDRFELVICDPPSYSTTKDSRFSSESDYRGLVEALAPLIAQGGKLLACSNHKGIARMKFRRYLHEALRAAGRAVTQMKDLAPPEDFPPAPGAEPHLKAVLVTVA
jgi:23S rRNA (cytosine1962-C5)-methyltransferase